ncbi:uncharacterized protein LOC134519040 [Chroicocephalus ridibundus]|uniref:uncharacterized protein LOC134519040 n=1 Tax=Chroicocephalus ridibundus TaxID=1192867 RepID=UPI002FDD7504
MACKAAHFIKWGSCSSESSLLADLQGAASSPLCTAGAGNCPHVPSTGSKCASTSDFFSVVLSFTLNFLQKAWGASGCRPNPPLQQAADFMGVISGGSALNYHPSVTQKMDERFPLRCLPQQPRPTASPRVASPNLCDAFALGSECTQTATAACSGNSRDVLMPEQAQKEKNYDLQLPGNSPRYLEVFTSSVHAPGSEDTLTSRRNNTHQIAAHGFPGFLLAGTGPCPASQRFSKKSRGLESTALIIAVSL